MVGFDYNLLLVKMESLILGKGLSLLLQRIGYSGGILLMVSLLDVDLTLANLMVASGASGASSSGVNQAPLLPALLPQPPAAELNEGGAANNNAGVGIVPPAALPEGPLASEPIPPLEIEEAVDQDGLWEEVDLRAGHAAAAPCSVFPWEPYHSARNCNRGCDRRVEE